MITAMPPGSEAARAMASDRARPSTSPISAIAATVRATADTTRLTGPSPMPGPGPAVVSDGSTPLVVCPLWSCTRVDVKHAKHELASTMIIVLLAVKDARPVGRSR